MRLKRMHILICSLLLAFTGIFFVACGEPDYSKVSLVCDETSVSLELEEPRTITFSIVNFTGGMSDRIIIETLNSSNNLELEQMEPRDGKTEVRLTGKKGGTTTLRAVTEDGLKECFVSVSVRQPSSTLENSGEKLFVSNSSPLAPVYSNFVFADGTTDRNLDYYFYGTYSLNGDKPALTDVQDENGNYIKEFTSVSLFTSASGESFLIFKNKEGQLYTLEDREWNANKNVPYNFIQVTTNEQGVFQIPENALKVSLGQKFAFLAKYRSSDDLFVQRDFYVLNDINKEAISYSYSYVISDEAVAEDSYDNTPILLVPNKVDTSLADYKRVRLEVTIPSASELIDVKESVDSDYVISWRRLGSPKKQDDSSMLYTYEISSKSTTKNSANFNFNYFYKGWENVKDESVNCTLEIPVNIEFAPTGLSVNKESGDSSSRIYTFYNYSVSTYGWQEFNINVLPQDSSYTYLEIEYNPSHVVLSHNNQSPSDVETDINGRATWKIENPNFNLPLYVKGVDGAPALNGQKIVLKLHSDLFDESDEARYEINYKIANGARTLDFVDDVYNREGVYIPFGTQDVDFNLLHADAEFGEKVEFKFSPRDGETDILDLRGVTQERLSDKNFLLNLKLRTKAVGTGTYSITLDNGKTKLVTFHSIETLAGLGFEYDYSNTSIKQVETNKNDKGEVIGETFYILHSGEGSSAELRLLANNNEQSTAVKSVVVNPMSGTGFEGVPHRDQYNNIVMGIRTNGNGHGTINFSIKAENATEDFKLEQVEKNFALTIVSYSLIDRIAVYKNRDGDNEKYPALTPATYTSVYVGTENLDARTAQFDVTTLGSGYRFYDPSPKGYVNGEYDPSPKGFVNEEFDKKFVYWTVSALVSQNGEYVDGPMIYSEGGNNDYTIDSFGVFNTDTMTFISDAKESFTLSLIANIRQMDRIYSYSISLQTKKYDIVTGIALQEDVDELYFSANNKNRTKDLVISYEPLRPTNDKLVYIFRPSYVTVEGARKAVNIFGEPDANGKYAGIDLSRKGDGSYLLSLDCSSFVGSDISKLEQNLTGTLIIAAQDWLDVGGNVKSGYVPISISIKYGNGTKENPFHLETAEDVIDIKNALNAYYEIATTIDMTGKSEQLPLGEFSGSIIGTNNYAKIEGLTISKADEHGNYGLFTKIAESGVINNVQFEGKIEVENVPQNSNIGLVAGVNAGELTNVGVTASGDSKISLQGGGKVGFVVGQNNGNISQDFGVYTDGSSIYNGLNPHILAYMGQYSINITGLSSAPIYAGGVAGENAGTIKKVDNKGLQLFGYSGYVAYANITVTIKSGKRIEDATPISAVGGIVGLGYGEIYAEGYKIEDSHLALGDGIIVGGTVEGPQYVGGAVGYYAGNRLEGITARTFVRGYTEYVGAITGCVASGAKVTSDNAPFAIQAVDDGRIGLEASMVIRYLESAPSVATTPSLNQIGFGPNSGLTMLNDNNVKSYLKRTKNGLGVVGAADGDDVYYGDYVEIVSVDTQKRVAVQTFFDLDTAKWTLTPNANFAKFTSVDGTQSNIYYAHYFEAASLLGATGNADITTAQDALDRNFNNVTSLSPLYPFAAAAGLILTSVNSKVVTFNQNGDMNVNTTGLAEIKVSSILNTKDSTSIYLSVVNYFNSTESYSSIYPDLTDEAVAVDNTSKVDVKGNNTVSHYVRPNYTYSYKDTNGNEVKVVDQNGVTYVGNMRITLAPNRQIVPKVEIISFTDKDGNTFSKGAEGFPTGETSLKIDVDGQMITYGKYNTTLEGTYAIQIKTYLKVNVPFGNGFKDYFAPVNMTIEPKVIYTKGASDIYTQKFDELSITTNRQGQDYVVVDSLSEESGPIYIIYGADGQPIQGTVDWIEGLKDKEGLFKVEFDKQTAQGIVGKQNFLLTVSVDKSSSMYQNRYDNDIYRQYRLELYASTDYGKVVSIPLYLENMNVFKIDVDNYENIANVEATKDFSSASKKAIPGRTGLLVLNISPEDADFDYIEIVNTSLSETTGNGKAAFNLIARKAGQEEGKVFDQNIIAGMNIPNGLRVNLKEIVDIYSRKDSNNESIYENYHGQIYLSYLIGTSGVVDNAAAQFRVTTFKNGVPSEPTIVTLTLDLEYYANVTIAGKTPLAGDTTEALYTYQAARGLRYKLDLNYYGFAFSDITVTSSQPDYANISLENGVYYLSIPPREDIPFYDYTNGFPIDILVEAYHKEGELEHSTSSKTRVNILEYVVNYSYENGDELRDIVSDMDNGVINVQVGNKESLSLDLTDIIEYDASTPSVVSKVEAFVESMTNSGAWTLYTNLNDSGIPTGRPVTIKSFVDRDNRPITPEPFKTFTIMPSGNYDVDQLYYLEARGLTLTPLRMHNELNNFYFFTYNGNFRLKEKTGTYEFAESGARLYTEFKFNVYQSSSADNPVPIDDYDDFIKMNDNVHYILTKDITIPNDFTPLTARIASLDGNGFKIYMGGNYAMQTSNMGLFESIREGTIIKNVTIAINANTVFSSSASEFYAGLLAGQNNGIITNCSVLSEADVNTADESVFSAECTDNSSASYIAGLVGQNTGKITNSRASVNITSSFNIGGLVGLNSGHIASSYFKNANLKGTTQGDHYVGGLVVSNETGGTIMTSYVSGETNADRLYSTDNTHIIEAQSPEGGFAFSNLGNISDCYTNITMDGSSEMAGFIHTNGGNIQNCFSTSVLVDKVISSAGFSMSARINENTGIFSNCYYFYNVPESEKPEDSEEIKELKRLYNERINSSLAENNFAGIKALNYKEFSHGIVLTGNARTDLAENFGEYSYAETATDEAVWFYSDGKTSKYFPNAQFNGGRLELVAPNKIANSKRKLVESQVDEFSGDTTYIYAYTEDSGALGSIENPYLISNADEFETYLREPASVSRFNNKCYRLISDIDFSNKEDLSQVYDTVYYGIFEGNGMLVSQIDLVSNDKLTNAGLFAQIGRDSASRGVVMNLRLQPKEVSFANTNCVGALAGTLSYGNIYNVDVITSQNFAVLGNNFVGGVVGRAINSYVIKNVTSQVSAVAYYKPALTMASESSYSQNMPDLNLFSYAGGVIGFAGGNGQLGRIYAEGVTDIMGFYCGSAIGGIGSNASARYLYVDVAPALYIKAYEMGYAGIAVGEIKGELNHVQVDGSESGDFFALVPGVPYAVGGVAGVMSGGRLTNAYVNQGFKVFDLNTGGTATKSINSVGGLVGLIKDRDSSISSCVVNANIEAKVNVLGGAVGLVEGCGLNLDTVAVKSTALKIYGRFTSVTVGGLVGQISPVSIVRDCYTNADITVETFTYTSNIESRVGSFIGFGVPSSMEYCFATGKLAVQLEDKLSQDGLQDIYTEYPGMNEEGFEWPYDKTKISYNREVNFENKSGDKVEANELPNALTDGYAATITDFNNSVNRETVGGVDYFKVAVGEGENAKTYYFKTADAIDAKKFDKTTSVYTQPVINHIYYFGRYTNKEILEETIVDMISFKAKVNNGTATFMENALGNASFASLNPRNAAETDLAISKDGVQKIVQDENWHNGREENGQTIKPWKQDEKTLIIYLAMEDSFDWLK